MNLVGSLFRRRPVCGRALTEGSGRVVMTAIGRRPVRPHVGPHHRRTGRENMTRSSDDDRRRFVRALLSQGR